MTTAFTSEHRKAVVEDYFQCLLHGNISALPVTSDYVTQSPMSGRLSGKAALDYLEEIGREMSDIRIVRCIAEGDTLAVQYDEISEDLVLPVCAFIDFRGDKICSTQVFFDSAAL
ncbi:nuclear transport factor 2 family protein [Aestuariicella hydrocarbonica]|uniref:Nuclear transport factor 2 family protein n=1 Tax=Pseudomaricurvus hydrocarbonicus TaxID=1470433 RepID=A0A9E5JQK7_9GAMM|nr:nuclear transport factor 2 family protein [Aestuariicella hydrocarbonica]NHO64872.1 nuclear transport factor 2 family protein [Aestuariicella hydrocarbonica]